MTLLNYTKYLYKLSKSDLFRSKKLKKCLKIIMLSLV